jgi:ribosomal protein S18 acetylase RimI-like enzyme|tara:strand:- start:148 stop:651 length:504 start_codon:yes stop_codon:yes gene_type:complete
VTEKIFRNYLEIKDLDDFKEVEKPLEGYSVKIADSKDFQLNKFFYKKIGRKHQWVDRLVWTDLKWINYVSNKNLFTYTLKDQEEIAGYFELLLNENKREAEIAYFGILEEYFGKKLGGYLLSEAIKQSFKMKFSRVWVHTCSLDHKNALGNYLSRGMRIFKTETLIR